jgi:hypothetical protein
VRHNCGSAATGKVPVTSAQPVFRIVHFGQFKRRPAVPWAARVPIHVGRAASSRLVGQRLREAPREHPSVRPGLFGFGSIGVASQALHSQPNNSFKPTSLRGAA